MRGKYKRKRLRKKYSSVIKKYREHPEQFVEDVCGIKLYWYQKAMLKMMSKKN